MSTNPLPPKQNDATQDELPITNPGVRSPETPIESLLVADELSGELVSHPETGEHVPLTARQERALRYLERKRLRHERVSQQTAVPAVRPVEPITPAPITPLPPLLPQKEHAPRRKKHIVVRFSRKHLRQHRLRERHAFERLWLTLGSIALVLLVIFLSLTGTGTYIGYQFYNDTMTTYVPRVISLHDLLPRDNLKMYDSKGILIAQLTDQGLHTSVTLDQISQDLIEATIATEDKNFWSNEGIDFPRIVRAMLDDLRNGRVVEGASTITQQLIKKLVLQNSDVTIDRKLQEVILTQQLNSHYTKSDILQMYLNSIYYGHQAYGIDAAATVYFDLQDQPGKSAASQLDLAQAAMLAGIPSSPTLYDPLIHPDLAAKRFQTVLDLMVGQGYITRVQELDAIKEAKSAHFFKSASNLGDRAPHFVNFVLSQLQDMLHLKRSQLSRSDLIVHTTLDVALQDKIQQIAQQHIAELRDYHNVHNAAEVLIDFHTGAIRSLLGSIDYNDKSIDGEYDVATQGYRQPGSSFKPYVYVTAFEQGASPAQAIADTPLTIYSNGTAPFTPQNYDGRYHGHMTLRCALQNSLNIPAVKVLQHVGIGAAMKTAHDMGIESYQGYPGYSLVLGGLGVHLIDHTSAMGTFANGGVHVPYYAIDNIVFARDHHTYVPPHGQGTQVISPQLAYMMTNVLSDNASRIPEFGDCNVLELYANSQSACYYGNRGQVRPAGAKTGTTNDFRDNWTIGYTTDYVMGVWAGNDDNSPMYNVSGVQGAAPIWHDAMLVAEQGHPIRDFTNPGGLVWANVIYPDGVQTSDWFLPATVPDFPIPAPTPQPTISSLTAMATGTPSPRPSPTPVSTKPPTPMARPYCPGDYTFAFQPPAASAASTGWW
ncbi:MAG TPA: transglycosylase domain-containing protein [Ktedonobacteraceae bacterium]|nr:transglycosylase domain-containing protein [Ktedonobacteraceae bacterium]